MEEMVTVGSRFGKLTVKVASTHMQRSVLMKLPCFCKCDCGGIIKLKVLDLISGKYTSCGCDSRYKGKLSEKMVLAIEDLAKRIDCNFGIARRYIEMDLLDEDIDKIHKPYMNGRVTFDWINRVSGNYVSHFRIEEVDSKIGVILGDEVKFDKLRCECGKVIYHPVVKNMLRKPPVCECDEYSKQFVPAVDKSVYMFNRYLCMKGDCIHYLGDGGCLDELAAGMWPKRWKADHTCMKSPKTDAIETGRSSIASMCRISFDGRKVYHPGFGGPIQR